MKVSTAKLTPLYGYADRRSFMLEVWFKSKDEVEIKKEFFGDKIILHRMLKKLTKSKKLISVFKGAV
jgi:hypothetical protein